MSTFEWPPKYMPHFSVTYGAGSAAPPKKPADTSPKGGDEGLELYRKFRHPEKDPAINRYRTGYGDLADENEQAKRLKRAREIEEGWERARLSSKDQLLSNYRVGISKRPDSEVTLDREKQRLNRSRGLER